MPGSDKTSYQFFGSIIPTRPEGARARALPPMPAMRVELCMDTRVSWACPGVGGGPSAKRMERCLLKRLLLLTSYVTARAVPYRWKRLRAVCHRSRMFRETSRLPGMLDTRPCFYRDVCAVLHLEKRYDMVGLFIPVATGIMHFVRNPVVSPEPAFRPHLPNIEMEEFSSTNAFGKFRHAIGLSNKTRASFRLGAFLFTSKWTVGVSRRERRLQVACWPLGVHGAGESI